MSKTKAQIEWEAVESLMNNHLKAFKLIRVLQKLNARFAAGDYSSTSQEEAIGVLELALNTSIDELMETYESFEEILASVNDVLLRCKEISDLEMAALKEAEDKKDGD